MQVSRWFFMAMGNMHELLNFLLPVFIVDVEDREVVLNTIFYVFVADCFVFK